ncbi:MAG: Asp-tRNA(Asn)/Glu-tRNA(Gln) amidotransferase subunit GatC [Holosporales bacterium]|jgi:aspartyl-tRNA(Asn)/glutamyl-tRNA(Gln) amidotransferase subunit C|nr:Asp-tRNA(Asn)/Glu-tRNA(Gln) amidotransferase subunit GatC [Holosporales bacterium]
MKISDQDVLKISELAKIKILPNEVPQIASELEKILEFVEQLNEIDCSGIEPLSTVTVAQAYERQDVVDDNNCLDDIVGNAPEQSSGMFVVPKIVE